MQNNCFVIMPFGGKYDSYWSEIIQPTVEKCGYSPIRSDKIFGARSIVSDIHEAIEKSDIVIADVTGKNPNVAYELGMAHAMSKPVIIIASSIKDVPFDFKHIRCIIYDKEEVRWVKKLSMAIRKTIKEISIEPSKHAVFSMPNQADLDMLKDHLKTIIFQLKAVLSKSETVTCNEEGDCDLVQRWEIKPETDLSHFSHNVSIGGAGEIEILRAHDILNDRILRTIDFERTDRKLWYGILFDDVKRSGSKAVVELDIRAEKYLLELMEKGETTTFYQGASKSNIKYGSIRQQYRFPNTSKFRNLSVCYFEHPNKNLIGKSIAVKKSKDVIEFCADFSTKRPQQYSFGITIKL